MLEVMGMHSSVSWLVWILTTFIFILIICGVMTTILKLGGLLPLSNWVLIFILLLCSTLATVSYA